MSSKSPIPLRPRIRRIVLINIVAECIGLFRTSFLHTARTPLPREGTREAAHALLHDHAAIIRLNPLVVAHERVEPPAAQDTSGPVNYLVTDVLDYLPFGLWKGKVTYRVEFENTEDGIKTKAYAAMGFVSESVWNVEEETGEGEEGTRLVLVETATVTCPRAMRLFVERTIRTSHDELGKRFVDKLAGESGAAGAS